AALSRVEGAAEGAAREFRHWAPRVYSTDPLGRGREGLPLGQEIGDGRHAPAERRPSVDQPHRISRARTQPPGIMMGAELGLVGRYVDRDRAVPLAALAGEAQR